MAEKPIEGGYGWVVLGCCFVLGILLTDGYATFGVFMVECTERYGYTEQQLLWVGAMRMSIAGFAGVFIGGLVQKYGCRSVTLIGTTSLLIGHISAALFPSLGIPWILVTYGILCGFGHGCYIVVYGSAFQEYFHKHRGLANGIVTVGVATGVFIGPSTLEYLFRTYGYTGAILINGAVYLNGCVLAMLIIPLKDRYPQKFKSTISATLSMDNGNISPKYTNKNQFNIMNDFNKPTYHKSLPHINREFHHHNYSYLEKPLHYSHTCLASHKPVDKDDLHHSLVLRKPISVTGFHRAIAAGPSVSSLILEKDVDFLTEAKSQTKNCSVNVFNTTGKYDKTSSSEYKIESHCHNNGEISPFSNKSNISGENKFLFREPEWGLINNRSSVNDDQAQNGSAIIAPNDNEEKYLIFNVFKKISELIDFSLLKDIPFLMYCIGLAMVHFGHVAPYALLPTRAVWAGIPKGPASFLVSILGMVNGGSRLMWGFSADLSCMSHHKPMLSGLSGILDGLTSVLSFMAHDYASFVVFSCLWGIFSGGYTSLHNMLVVHLLDVDNIGRGAGTLLTILGFSWLSTYLLAGFLIEMFSSVVAPFFVLGGIEIAGGIVITVIPFVHKRPGVQLSTDNKIINTADIDESYT